LKLQGIIWSSGKYEEWNIVWRTFVLHTIFHSSYSYCILRKWRKPPFLKTFVKIFNMHNATLPRKWVF
jgi:hypothetical protein